MVAFTLFNVLEILAPFFRVQKPFSHSPHLTHVGLLRPFASLADSARNWGLVREFEMQVFNEQCRRPMDPQY